MYYNLEKFGSKVRQIRKALVMSQADLFKLTGIAIATISRIELGQVIPKQETLDLLSAYLYEDLNRFLLECRIDRYECYNSISKSIFHKIEVASYERLPQDAVMLRKLIKSDMSDYYSIRCKQILRYIESIIFESRYKDCDLTIDKLSDAIKISIRDFELNDYKIYKYNDLSLLFVMNIGIAIRHTDGIKRSHEILKFCFTYYVTHNLSSDFFLYEKLCFNLSYSYHRRGLYEQSLKYAEIGIDFCNEHRLYNFIGLLYVRKGVSEYLLKNEAYVDSLLKAKYFLELTGHHKNLEKFVAACKKHYGLDLHILRNVSE